jgi:serine protease SohB
MELAELLADYGLFLAKTVTVLGALVAALLLVSAVGGLRRDDGGRLEIRRLNDRYRSYRDALREAMLQPGARSARRRLRASLKRERKRQGGAADRPRVYVINFKGDLRGSAVSALREEISAVLSVAEPRDEVVLRLESAGGLVNAYGLAASQLRRVRDAGIPLTACVDKVAASGGYLMAGVANRILAAPFAVLGSIGVVAQLPNFHRLLKKNDIDYELLTAGEYKRTLTVFGENTPEGRQKFAEELDDTHALFKEFVAANRPQLDVESVATGEIWFGERALANKLVDALETSDSYLLRRMQEADVFEVRYRERRRLGEQLGVQLRRLVSAASTRG